MTTEIFIVSFRRDFEYLKFCLRSIVKFATGFSGVTVLVPDQDYQLAEQLFIDLNADFKFPATLAHGAEWPERGHLWHICQKLRSDEWCPKADFICHLDSDCVFREPVTPDDYFVDGKPVLLIEEYAGLEKQFPGFPWRRCVEKALKEPVKYETMRRHPMVNPRGLYPAVRNLVESRQGMPFDEYVIAQRWTFPAGFADFNTLGAVALMPPWKDQYHFIEVGGDRKWPHSKLIQFWAHTGLEIPQDVWVDTTLHKGVKPIELMKQFGL